MNKVETVPRVPTNTLRNTNDLDEKISKVLAMSNYAITKYCNPL